MEVKCPRCRFRYDIDASSGLSEIACVCPRCGTPFTYTITDESNTNIRQENLPSNRITEDTSGDDKQVDGADIASSQENQANASERINPVPHTGFQQPYITMNDTGNTKNGQKRNYTRYFIVLLIVAFVVSVFMIRSCNRKKYYSEQALPDDVEIVQNQKDANSMDISTNDDVDVSSAKMPKWLQGNWSVHTDYGVITLRIHGNKIAETSGGRTSYGTFVYEKDRLSCDFGDGQTMYYKLNESTQRIDAGNGMWMEKTN